MDFPSALGEVDRKLENGSFFDNLGNYVGIFGVTFVLVTVLQVLGRKFLNFIPFRNGKI